MGRKNGKSKTMKWREAEDKNEYFCTVYTKCSACEVLCDADCTTQTYSRAVQELVYNRLEKHKGVKKCKWSQDERARISKIECKAWINNTWVYYFPMPYIDATESDEEWEAGAEKWKDWKDGAWGDNSFSKGNPAEASAPGW